MALIVQKGEIPKDAVILTKEEALQYQWEQIWDWKPASEVWPFRYGIGILGVFSAATGLYINNHYRNKLLLGQYGRISTYLPIVIMPGLLSSLFHQQFVTQDLVLENLSCPVCLQMRAAAFQCGIGVVYPFLLAPLANFMFATRHATVRLPYITEPMKTFSVWKKLTRPIGTNLTFILIAQAFSAVILTYFEGKSYYRMQNKLMLMEEEFNRNQNSH